MITQQLTSNPNDMSGQLLITAEPGALVELQSLAAELKLRPNVETNGTIEISVPEFPEPGNG